MNKEELIEKLRSDLYLTPDNQFRDGYNNGVKNSIILVKELKEIKKPVVPQFVADWYEGHKRSLEWTLRQLGLDIMNGVFNGTEMHDWLNNSSNKPIQTIVNMHQFGYEVEKEKLYEVFLKRTGVQLGVITPDYEDKSQFTAKELKECGFDNLDVYEVKEVEE